MNGVRMDLWLWAARFFKTRPLAKKACELGRILSNGQPAKAAREVRVGDRLRVTNDGGDFEIARNVSLFDDDFEVVLFEGRSSLRYVPYFAGLAVNRLQGMKGVTMMRARQVSLPSSDDGRVYVQVDGESAGHLPAEIRIVPQALTLLVPREYGRRL